MASCFLLAACALGPRLGQDPMDANTLGDRLLEGGVRDLRDRYRAALCLRLQAKGADCTRALHGSAMARATEPPPAANPAEYRLVFVPGFLSNCVPGFNTFADAIAAAKAAGFATELLEVGGRASMGANAALVAEQLARLARDRRLIVIGHSKGVVDALEALVQRPDLAARVDGVIGIAGAFNGSPLADRLRTFYRWTVSASPLLRCEAGHGDEIDDMRPGARASWWLQNRTKLEVPLYALAAVPDPDRVSPMLLLPRLGLSAIDRYNDGQLLARDQIPPGGALLGVVNADHLEATMARTREPPWSLLMAFADVPRADLVLAAVDVVAADDVAMRRGVSGARDRGHGVEVESDPSPDRR